MSLMIFYFSGAGNSYAVAKKIADQIEGEQLVPLARFKDFKQCDNAIQVGEKTKNKKRYVHSDYKNIYY